MSPHRRCMLFVREVPWESVYPISTRMIAEQFLRHDWHVIWMTLPLMPWHWRPGGVAYRAQLLRQNREGGIFYENGRVFAYTPRTWLPFSRHAPLDRAALAHHVWDLCGPSIPEIMKRSGMPSPDVLWLSGFLSQGIAKFFPGIPSVQHVTDYYQGYPTSPANCGALERNNYLRADQVVVTAPSLKQALVDEFDTPADKINVISHGANLEPFLEARSSEDPLPDAPHPRLVMLGNLGKIDFNILAHLCLNLREGCVLALGPVNEALERLATKHGNLRLEGPVRPERVPAYLAHGDVGLVLFSRSLDRVVEHVNPMKLYEYAASGLPVASTPVPVYRDLDARVLVGHTPGEVWRHVREALGRRNELRPEMLRFAAGNTWAMRYREALGVLERAGVRQHLLNDCR